MEGHWGISSRRGERDIPRQRTEMEVWKRAEQHELEEELKVEKMNLNLEETRLLFV